MRISWQMFLLLTILMAGVGCSRTATVTGKVSYQGKPVRHGSVIFLASNKIARSGVIESDGTYSVENVPPGEVRIGVISRDPSKSGRHARSEDEPPADKRKLRSKKDAPPADWFPLPQKLEDPASSGLKCTIGTGNVKHDIDLN